MKVTKGKAAELYQALVEQSSVHPQQEDEFSAREFINDTGLSDSAAHATLRKLVAEGKLTRRSTGQNRYVYKFTDPT
jgi:Fic family protein